LSARKTLGQNFILDFNQTRRIARAGGPLEGITVVEIGAGPGGLTRAFFMEGAERVVAIERDQRCLPALNAISGHYPGRLEIVEGDALEIDYPALSNGPARVIANLPYNIATPLLVGWLKTADWPPWYDRLVLMFQREVAERVLAAPGSRNYGRLSVITQWRAQARSLLSLPASVFTPPPKVDSTLLEITPTPQPEDTGSLESLETVTAAAFGQRRKMLRSSLKSCFHGIDLGSELPSLDLSLRAEQISVADYCALARTHFRLSG
jgi:16S rRNA (adenine1518-N6/adenine1519-N6)-dimethyltransferase